MKKIIYFACFILLVFFSFGCEKKNRVKVEFTEDYRSFGNHLSFKLPEEHQSTVFQDQGSDCKIYVYLYPSKEDDRHIFEDKLKDMGEKTINDVTYQWFKNKGVYKFKYNSLKGEVYSLVYYCDEKYDDDDQVFRFMKTVTFDELKEVE